MFALVRILWVVCVVISGTAAVASSSEIGEGRIYLLGTPNFAEVKLIATWIVASNDNHDLPFMVIDKVQARLFLFSPSGRIQATTAALVGLARGDDSPPGIGARKLSAIKPAERITPAGRFILEPGENLEGRDIIWIDYNAAISLHRASDRKPGMSDKSREQRLASTTAAERRVSFGCINVSTAFYNEFIRPTFGASSGVAYILPETRSPSDQFHMRGGDIAQAALAMKRY